MAIRPSFAFLKSCGAEQRENQERWVPGGLAPPEPKFGDSDAGGRRMLKMVKREEKTTGNTSREFMYDGSF